MIRSLEDASQRRSKEISWWCVTHRRAEDIFLRARPRTRSYRVASTGPLFLHRVSIMSSIIKHLQARWDVDAVNPLGWHLRSMGDRLHETLTTFKRKRVHFGSGGLCVQVGQSDPHKDKRPSGGALIYYEVHLLPLRMSEGHHQWQSLKLQ